MSAWAARKITCRQKVGYLAAVRIYSFCRMSLPPDILQIIRRKSSRDPMSRFSNKLHILLTYAGDDPAKQMFVGAGWTSETSFRINKKRLITVMEIKLNTLNVNLKDLKFNQLQGDQNGWTVWSRAGFTRQSTIDELADVRSDKCVDGDRGNVAIVDESQLVKLAALKDLVLGGADSQSTQLFKRFTISIWEELIPSPAPKYSAENEELLSATAKRFRVPGQKFENAVTILRTIFRPEIPQISLLDFAKFMARFGPEETLMQKIGSLFHSSNDNEKWLKITDSISQFENEKIYGYCDETEHNCFVIKRRGFPEERVYNLYDVPATEEYLVDSLGRKYSSWEDYFKQNPVVW